MKLCLVIYWALLYMHITSCLWYVIAQRSERFVLLINYIYPYTTMQHEYFVADTWS